MVECLSMEHHMDCLLYTSEMTNLIDASRGYEANETAFEASKAIALKGLAGLSQ